MKQLKQHLAEQGHDDPERFLSSPCAQAYYNWLTEALANTDNPEARAVLKRLVAEATPCPDATICEVKNCQTPVDERELCGGHRIA